YNVVEKLRSGEVLTPTERTIHEIAACGVLRDLHDELNALVAEAYGWPWPMEPEEILERLVKLHDERVEEEKGGKVRWLRPEYQVPKFGRGLAPPTELALMTTAPAAAPAELPTWPETAIEQLAAIKTLLATRVLSRADVAKSFAGTNQALVDRHLETLTLMGELVHTKGRKYSAENGGQGR
ncbi:MAG: class I SAM-dependent DNA methyltransferase, partial [Gemmatimonadales bacterium]